MIHLRKKLKKNRLVDVLNSNGMWKCSHVNSDFIRSLALSFFDLYTLFYLSSWLVIRYTRTNNIEIPYLNNWLTDFVFIPLVLHFSQVLVFFTLGYSKNKVYSLGSMLLFSIYVSIFFEYLAPNITSYNTADWIDVIAYILGALFYNFIHLPHLLKKFN